MLVDFGVGVCSSFDFNFVFESEFSCFVFVMSTKYREVFMYEKVDFLEYTHI